MRKKKLPKPVRIVRQLRKDAYSGKTIWYDVGYDADCKIVYLKRVEEAPATVS